MAEAHKFSGGREGLREAAKVFPGLPWRWNHGGTAYIHDEKKGEDVVVNEGDYIVRVGDRFEVSDSKPRNAKKAAAPKEDDTEDSDNSEDDADVPEAKRAEPQPDPTPGEAEVASTPNGATSFES